MRTKDGIGDIADNDVIVPMISEKLLRQWILRLVIFCSKI